MLFQVTEIEFDFDDEEEMNEDEKNTITNECIGQVWEVIDEDDLIDEITCMTGWSVKSIDYRHVLV